MTRQLLGISTVAVALRRTIFEMYENKFALALYIFFLLLAFLLITE